MCVDDKDTYCTLMVSPHYDCGTIYVVRRVEANVVEYIKNRDELRRGL